jgi:glycosyltransferase involved in cell wall biosynthesis
MPVYNGARHLRESILSIIRQSFQDWELVLVDDGSTDQTAAIAQECATADSRIRVMRIPHSGRGVARNVAIANASGRFVAVCDADDISLPHRFATQAELLDAHPEIAVVTCHEVIAINDHSEPVHVIRSAEGDHCVRERLARGRMSIQNAAVMMRAELFSRYGLYDTELRRAQDFNFFLRIFDQERFMSTGPLILYRVAGSIERWSKLAENNAYRHYAYQRAMGEQRSFEEYYRQFGPRLYRRLVIPLMFVWYLIKRLVLRTDLTPLREEHRRMAQLAMQRVSGVQLQLPSERY